ncbi:MAG: hypothetical protein WCN95_04245 [bacterium]
MGKLRTRQRAAGFAAFLFLLAFSCIAFWTTVSAGPDQSNAPDASALPRSDAFRPWDDAGLETPADTWPEWLTGWSSSGGIILTNPPAWYVPADVAEGTDNSLYFCLDRRYLTNDLTLEMSIGLTESAQSSLYLDLLTTNMLDVVTNLFGNLLLGDQEGGQLRMDLPMATNPAASVIRLRHSSGAITVYGLSLWESNTGVVVEPSAGSGQQDIPQGEITPGTGGADALDVPVPDSSQPDDTTNPGESSPQTGRGKALFVDAVTGHDDNDGFAAAVESSGRGPKKTINGALRASRHGDEIRVLAGQYHEDVNDCGLGVTIYFDGDVRIE